MCGHELTKLVKKDLSRIEFSFKKLKFIGALKFAEIIGKVF